MVPTQVAFSQESRFDELDLDREGGVICDAADAYSQDGGLAVLFGNLAEDGCIVKTAGVDALNLAFTGTARVFESQDVAVYGIFGKVTAGEVVLIRYEGPRGGRWRRGLIERVHSDVWERPRHEGYHGWRPARLQVPGRCPTR